MTPEENLTATERPVTFDEVYDATVKARIMAEMVQKYCEQTQAARCIPAVDKAAKAATDSVALVVNLLSLQLNVIASRQAEAFSTATNEKQDLEVETPRPNGRVRRTTAH